MFQYIEKVTSLLNEVADKEKNNIETAIDWITDANINKKSIYIFGASHAGILSEEMFYRAGGMITFNAIFGKEVMLDRKPITFTSKMERLEGYGTALASTVDFKKDDILILHSVSGRNPIIIDLGLAAKKKGVKIIAITNVTYSNSADSRHSSGKKLKDIADLVIDNHGDIGDGGCEIEGVVQKVGPTSTVVGASILNSIIVEVTRKMANKGVKDLPIFYSANLDGGDELNKNLVEEYQESIHYQF